MTTELRRASVLRSAVREFSGGGFHGTSTVAIARGAKVSQSYLFRFFPSKKAIFLAASAQCVDQIADSLRAAARGLAGDTAMRAMWRAWEAMVEDRALPMMLAQTCAAAAGDPDIARHAAGGWDRLWVAAAEASGMPEPDVARFFAHAMLGVFLVPVDVAADHGRHALSGTSADFRHSLPPGPCGPPGPGGPPTTPTDTRPRYQEPQEQTCPPSAPRSD
ncbi:TetR/AcrR family transcriptional regulator [Actinacidiphila reveromycinica]|nr:TetR/AcrR family transcriptional regulator [Streptomyces sp. SN-593]